MRIGYAKPAEGEIYLIKKAEARQIARSIFPDLRLLTFQTIHGVRRSEEFPYLATFMSWHFVRILSIRSEFYSEELATQFRDVVLPYIFRTAKYYQDVSYNWPLVIVGVKGDIHQVSCSAGFQFPNYDEVMKKIHKHPVPICSYKSDA